MLKKLLEERVVKTGCLEGDLDRGSARRGTALSVALANFA
jgi:hypothetical protein